MNTKALLRLADLMEKVDAEERNFDIDAWAGFKVDDTLYSALNPTTAAQIAAAEHACGTSACACGYAALDPWFRQQGFKMVLSEWDESGRGARTEIKTVKGFNKMAQKIPSFASEKKCGAFHLTFHNREDWGAVKQFFGLSEDQGAWLFSGAYYDGYSPTALDVAKRIRAFVASGGEVVE